MTLSELCIRRPVMTTLMMASFVLLGIFGYLQLPVAALPQVDYPTISVSANLAGASADTMATSVAAPLERAFTSIPGVSSMTSTSNQGETNITLQFDLNRNIDGAALDVQSEIAATIKRLPAQMTEAPNFRKVNPGDAPIVFLSLSSSTLPLTTVQDYAEQVFSQQISQLPGVAQVLVFGQQRYAVRIEADPDKAAARGLTLGDIGAAVAAANSSLPVGTMLGKAQNTTLNMASPLTKAADFANVAVAWRNGAPVKLSDVARVYDGVENDQLAAWRGDATGMRRGIVMAIFRQPDANTVAVVDSIRERMPHYVAQLPPAISAVIVNDRSQSIRRSVEEVRFTLGLSIMLVILVIFLFLKSLSATIIPALALPVSLIGAFAFMWAFGYSIDNISLLAITLSVGFVVDDAIVMLENIMRHVEEGMAPFEAAMKGSREIAFTILSITFSLVAVFLPVLMMGSIVGRVLREFAVTITVAILVSGFVSLTLTPMLCARVLHAVDHDARHGLMVRIVDAAFGALSAGYRVSLDWVLKARAVVIFVTLGTIFLSLSLYGSIPKGFFPLEDTGYLIGFTQAAPDSSIDAMKSRQQAVARIVGADPAVRQYVTAVGRGGLTSNGFMFVALKPYDVRGDVLGVLARLRKAVTVVPGIRSIFQPVQNLNFTGGRPSAAQYQYTLQSGDTGALYSFAPKVEALMSRLKEVRDVSSDLQIKNPQFEVKVDDAKAAALGVTNDQIRSALYAAFGTQQVSTIFTEASDYQVIMTSDPKFQDDPSAIGRIFVKSASTDANGQRKLVPLSEVTKVTRGVGPLTINRQSQQPSVTISFNLGQGYSIGQATDAIRGVERDVHLPATIVTNFAGTAQLFQQALKGQGFLLLAAVLVIYVLLGVLYESFIHPITILSGLPSAGLGALLALRLFHLDLTIVAIIGILLLIGIVKKNAIMMVDFAIGRRAAGADALSAIREAANVRFRPIFMTTMAAILGALPIALASGAGSELRKPLGIAIVGGLLVSQLLTLYITPVVYYYLDFVDAFFSGRGRGAKPAAG
ncbi:MAG: efflux RND transporter permease subunit, partial [Hyphomicrobiales bacterium]|nr:efflux RND transporter permease subunit [Hyphomicrobiales bacterium]